MHWLKELPYFPQIVTELKRIHGGADPRNNTVVFKLPAKCNISNIFSALRLHVPSNAGLEEMARMLVTKIGVSFIAYTDWLD
jgi:hypothetical protein